MKTNRAIAFVIDLASAGVLAILLGAILSIFLSDSLSSNITYYIALLVFFAKDFYSTYGSFGKKIMKLNLVLERAEHRSARIFLRNISLLLWPVEAAMVLFNNRRLGDIICSTKVQLRTN